MSDQESNIPVELNNLPRDSELHPFTFSIRCIVFSILFIISLDIICTTVPLGVLSRYRLEVQQNTTLLESGVDPDNICRVLNDDLDYCPAPTGIQIWTKMMIIFNLALGFGLLSFGLCYTIWVIMINICGSGSGSGSGSGPTAEAKDSDFSEYQNEDSDQGIDSEV